MNDPSVHRLEYARPATTPGQANWSDRLAGLALVGIVLSPATSIALIFLAGKFNWSGGHFLCCRHPEVAVAVFVVAPLLNMGIGIVAAVKEFRQPRPSRRILAEAIIAAIVSLVWVVLGMAVTAAVKM